MLWTVFRCRGSAVITPDSVSMQYHPRTDGHVGTQILVSKCYFALKHQGPSISCLISDQGQRKCCVCGPSARAGKQDRAARPAGRPSCVICRAQCHRRMRGCLANSQEGQHSHSRAWNHAGGCSETKACVTSGRMPRKLALIMGDVCKSRKASLKALRGLIVGRLSTKRNDNGHRL